MDIFSHWLWWWLVTWRKHKKQFYASFIIWMLPDLIPFWILFVLTFLWIVNLPAWQQNNVSWIPWYIFFLYAVTHSLIIFAIVFFVTFLILKKFYLPFIARFLHIIIDIPTHSLKFFPTPFLWPICDFKIDWIPWSNPKILISDLIILFILYSWIFVLKKKKQYYKNIKLK